MKKLLTGLLALLTCFTCATAVACGDDTGDDSSSTPPASESSDTGSSDTGSSDTGSSDSSGDETDDELADAAAYLEELYRDANAETRADYEVLPAIWGYNIAWSVTLPEGVTEGVSIKTENGKVIVDVDELLDEDLEYVLTGVVSNEAGQSVTVSFTRVVKAAPSLIPEAITEAPVEGVAYKYHVYQSTLAKDLYFAGGMAAKYYFSTTEDSAEAVDVYAEYVAGSTTEFYLYFNHTTDGKQYFGVKVSDDGEHDNIVYTSEPISTFVWNETLGTVTTHLEATKNNGGPNDFYFGNYGTKDTISASYTSYAGGAGNNVGHLVTMVDRNSITPEKKVADSKEGLNLASTEITGAKEVELPAARHVDVIVTWTVSENAYASIVDGKLVTTNPAEDTTVTLTATLTCGDVTDTKEFTLTLKHASDLPAFDTEITIPQANAIGEAQAANVLTEGKYYVSGVVTEVKNTQYGNLYIEDADGNRLYVYGCYDADGTNRYDAMANAPQVGDTVKLYSAITSYNGSAQLKNAWVVEWTAGSGSGDSSSDTGSGDVDVDLTTPEAILNALYALNDNESLEGSFTLTGKITALDNYNNPTIVVEGFENMPVYCYKLVVSNAVGDVITVTATSMKNYKGTYEFMNCTLVDNSGDSSSDTGSDSDSSDTGSGDVDEVVKATGDSFTIESYATANGWANSTCYPTIEHESYTLSVKATAVGTYGQNSGKYYTSSENSGGPCWRIYQTEDATITFIAAEGKTIASIKITYAIKNTGILTFNGANVASDEVVTVNGATATFGVGQTGTATNGQVQIQAIEVIFAGEEVPTYTLVLMDGNPRMGGTREEIEYVEGATLELPTLEAEGKTFLGWFAMDDNDEPTVAAPATMPAEPVALYAVWEVSVYTLTIVNGEESTEFKFAVEYTNEILISVNDLAYVLEDNLPEGCKWAEVIPETFELKDYTFTAISEEVPTYTLVLMDGNPRMGGTREEIEYVEGATLELPTLEAEGKTFLGWFAMDDNDEPTVAAPATMPAEPVALYAVWEVSVYTLTIVNGEESTEFKFAVEYTNEILISVNDLAYVLEDNLPADASYVEAIPETFELKDYTFTVLVIETLTIPEAIELGASKAHNTYTTDKYYVNGIIVAITNTTYGNMTIADELGNELTVYGSYSADGSTQFGSMTNKPVVGQVVKFLSVVGAYSGSPQLKNAWIVEISEATEAQKIAVEKLNVSVAESVNGAREIEVATAGTLYADVVIAWEVTAGNEIASIADGVLTIANPAEDVTVTVVATLTVGDVTDTKEFTIAVTHKDESATEPSTLAKFDFGANGAGPHADGSEITGSKSYTENGYTLTLTNLTKVYAGAKDETGISCLKLGTSSAVATLTFTVPENVTSVVIYVAGYKAKTSKITVNGGTATTISTSSNDGAYTAITIDTTTTKTITISTVSGACRVMIDAIEFIGL